MWNFRTALATEIEIRCQGESSRTVYSDTTLEFSWPQLLVEQCKGERVDGEPSDCEEVSKQIDQPSIQAQNAK
jgi:hypothetical protein